ncbi:MAG: NUDIX domain-containing protein [Pseudomonadota bacterium]
MVPAASSDGPSGGSGQTPPVFERSATVLLLDDSTGPMQVLMGERAATMGFAAGALVFPGGKVDQADKAPPWRLADGSSHRALQASPDTEHDVRVAAIRELFEECGILLAYRDGELLTGEALSALVPDLMAMRNAINDDAQLFAQFLTDHALTPAFDQLTFFARWKTPAMVNRRFDTWFFAARVPPGHVAVADGAESLSAEWATPTQFLARSDKGDAKIIFPTARNLERLRDFGSVKAVIAHGDPGERDAITPAVKDIDGERYLTIPDGLGYPVTREALEKAVRG